jgi:AbrB family looped-hinge helix DNA binding protein
MTQRVGAKGQVVIPKELRERSGLHPGSEVEFALDGDRVVLWAHRGTRHLGGRFGRSGMAARLVEDRKREPR